MKGGQGIAFVYAYSLGATTLGWGSANLEHSEVISPENSRFRSLAFSLVTGVGVGVGVGVSVDPCRGRYGRRGRGSVVRLLLSLSAHS